MSKQKYVIRVVLKIKASLLPEGCGAHLMQISSGQGLVGIFVVQAEPMQTVDNFPLPVFVTNGPIVFVLSTHSVNGAPFARTASSFHH